MRKLVLLMALAIAASFACSEGDTDVSDQICNPGSPDECDCADGVTTGTKTCNAAGLGWSACMNCIPEQDIKVQPDVADVKDPMVCDPPCGEGLECQEGKCVCIPQCENKDCGDDGCGATCGDCKQGFSCDDKNKCVPPTGDCYLKACMIDDHCKGCPNALNKCWADEHKCVECVPGSNTGCPEGLKCSLSGKCTAKTCATDAQGEPTIECLLDSDCEACSPKHQTCDVSTNKCVQCVGFADPSCLDSQYCVEGKCEPKCPSSCDLDNDCQFCQFGATGGEAAKPAKACNNHKCSECSATWPCSADKVCLPNGVCYPPCGLPGPVQGTCDTHEDCYYCGDPKNPGAYECKKPVNDPNGHGTCFPPAEGCEDLGAGVAVLPEPYDQYTELCSNDGNCANITIDYNVGKLIRELAGVDEVMGVEIGDATVKYGMHQCAEIKVTNNIDCGICVPCKEDVDCLPISVDDIIVDLFSGNALAQIAGLMLVNMLYGDADTHNLHFYCQPVGLGYGACLPCGNPTQACGKTDPGGGSGNCDHTVCEVGTALDPSCSACAMEVCSNDGFCCNEEWDQVCVGLVDKFCATSCGGTGGCDDDICTNPALPAQTPSCGPCVAAVCEADPFCCNDVSGAWDQYCVDGAGVNPACEAQCGGGGGCAHDPCVTGGPLAADCDPCVTSVCGYDDWCCTNDWDSVCIDEAIADDACNCS